MKTAYSYNPDTLEYTGETIARKDPLEKEERFLVPANATEKQPAFEDGKTTKFVNGNWILEAIPEPEPDPEATLEEVRSSKINELNYNRSQFCLIPIEYNGNTYATTLEGKQAIAFLANRLENSTTGSIYFTYPQQNQVSLTREDFNNLALEIQTREVQSRVLRNSKFDEINAIEAIDDILAIDIKFE